MPHEEDNQPSLRNGSRISRIPRSSTPRFDSSAGSARARQIGVGIERICVLDVEPELRSGLDPTSLPEQRRAASALTWSLPRGRFSCAPGTFDLEGSLGLLIVEGLIIRHLLTGDMEILELVGPGDVLCPSVDMNAEMAHYTQQHWTVMRRARFAILDRSFTLAVSSWPEIAANISDRVAMRVGWMALSTAIRGLRRVDRRLLAMLWFYANRWGRVTPEGVVLELELTHRQLAGLVGARRPSVTTALSALERSGEIHRRHDRSWLLRGERPALTVSPPATASPAHELSALATGTHTSTR